MNNPCPTCNGKQIIATPDGRNFQICPRCDGNGEDPGIRRTFFYIFQGTLTALQVLLNQRIVTNGDAPFEILLLAYVSTGAFRIRFFDSNGQYYSSSGEGGTNDRARVETCFGNGSLPFVVDPPIQIPPGGYIGFDLEDVSNAGNTVHLNFMGVKLYPTPRS